MDRYVTYKKITRSTGLLVGCRETIVFELPFTQGAVQFCANQMLKYGTCVIHPR